VWLKGKAVRLGLYWEESGSNLEPKFLLFNYGVSLGNLRPRTEAGMCYLQGCTNPGSQGRPGDYVLYGVA
jgi:hypothetical protein